MDGLNLADLYGSGLAPTTPVDAVWESGSGWTPTASGTTPTVDPLVGDMQSMFFGTGGVLNRLLDIETMRYAGRRLPEPHRPSTQTPVGVPNDIGSMNLRQMLPFAIVGLIVWKLTKG